jgi:hypothetical protein
LISLDLVRLGAIELDRSCFGMAEVLLRSKHGIPLINESYASVHKKADISGGAAAPPYQWWMANWFD